VKDWPVYVSLAEARAFARWRGLRLPTEAEFHRAAYGDPTGGERAFPWGAATPGREHGNFDFRCWAPTPVGAFPEGASAWGVHDLVGNGWEWTDTPFTGFPGFEAWITGYRGTRRTSSTASTSSSRAGRGQRPRSSCGGASATGSRRTIHTSSPSSGVSPVAEDTRRRPPASPSAARAAARRRRARGARLRDEHPRTSDDQEFTVGGRSPSGRARGAASSPSASRAAARGPISRRRWT